MTKKYDSNKKYAYLYELSHEKLMELLLSAPIPATNAEDEIYVDALEETILAKEGDTPTGLIPDVGQQWMEFQKHYCNSDISDDVPTVQEDLSSYPKSKSVPVPKVKRRWLGRTFAIAAIMIVLVALTIPAALGYANVFEMLGHWTDDYFQFIPASKETSPSDTIISTSAQLPTEFDTPQEALDAYGVTQKILPTWFPEGFALSESDIYTLDAVDQNEFSFFYSDSDSSIFLLFIQHTDNSIDSGKYQKDVGPVEEYQVGNISYYLYTNSGQSCASWCIDNMECSIYGDISMDELKKMIDSIEV